MQVTRTRPGERRRVGIARSSLP